MNSLYFSQAFGGVEIQGPDARDFLHRLTTVNLHSLKPGEARPGCFLTAQGRIEAFFHILCVADTRFILEVSDVSDFMALIERYTFSEKITTAALPRSMTAIWVSKDVPGESQVGESFTLLAYGDRDYGQPMAHLIGNEDSIRAWLALNAPSATLLTDPEALEQLRIQQVRPSPGHEISSDVSPLEIGIPEAIAPNKGCYPGQEVIEKIIALGAPARRLVRLSGEGATPPRNSELRAKDGTPIGKLTSVARTPNGFVGLALVRKTQAQEGTEVITSTQAHGRIEAVAPYQAH